MRLGRWRDLGLPLAICVWRLLMDSHQTLTVRLAARAHTSDTLLSSTTSVSVGRSHVARANQATCICPIVTDS